MTAAFIPATDRHSRKPQGQMGGWTEWPSTHKDCHTQEIPLLGWRAQGSWGLRSCPGPGPVSSGPVSETDICLRTTDAPHKWPQGAVSPSLTLLPQPCLISGGSTILPVVMPEALAVRDLSSCHLTSGHQHILLTIQETSRTMDRPMSPFPGHQWMRATQPFQKYL